MKTREEFHEIKILNINKNLDNLKKTNEYFRNNQINFDL